MATPGRTIDRTYDTNLQLSDGGAALTAAAGTVTAMQVSSANKILDVGAARFAGDMVIDMGAVAAGSGIGSLLLVQGSNSSTFASGVFTLAAMPVGDILITGETVDDLGAARYIVPFENVKKGVTYRYVRGAVLAFGTTESTVVTLAFVAKRD